MKLFIILGSVILLAIYSVDAGVYLSTLNINAPGDRTAPVKNYGGSYGHNKRVHVEALKNAGLYDAYLALAVAVGMQETSTFNPADYDSSKTGDSTNYSAFNFNRDMLRRVGITGTDYYNTWGGVGQAATAFKTVITRYGIDGFLNYHRGGYTAWQDGHSYDAYGYRNAIASIVRYIENDNSLLYDDRRVDMDTGHQG